MDFILLPETSASLGMDLILLPETSVSIGMDHIIRELIMKELEGIFNRYKGPCFNKFMKNSKYSRLNYQNLCFKLLAFAVLRHYLKPSVEIYSFIQNNSISNIYQMNYDKIVGQKIHF